MPTQQQIMDAMGWNDATWNIYMQNGLNPMSVMQQYNPSAYAALNSTDAGNSQTSSASSGGNTTNLQNYYSGPYASSPSVLATPVSGQPWNQPQPQNTLQFIGSIGENGVNSSTAPEILQARQNSLNQYAQYTPQAQQLMHLLLNSGIPNEALPWRPGVSAPDPAMLNAMAANLRWDDPRGILSQIQQFSQYNGPQNTPLGSGSQNTPPGSGTQNPPPGGQNSPPGSENIKTKASIPPGRIGDLIRLGFSPQAAANIDKGYSNAPGLSAQELYQYYLNGYITQDGLRTGGGDPGPGGGNISPGNTIESLFQELMNQAKSPGSNPSGFNWEWSDWDGNKPNPSQWGLNLTQNISDISQLQTLLQSINGLGYGSNLPVNFGQYQNFVQEPNNSGQFITNWGSKQRDEDLFDLIMGLQGGQAGGYQDYNNALDQYITGNFSSFLPGQFRNVSMESLYNDPSTMASYLGALDSLREQMGLPSRRSILQGGTNQNPLNISAFAGTNSGTPYTPALSPLEGFKWSFIDPDGQGGAPPRWMQTLGSMPTSQSQAQAFLERINGQNPLGFNLPTGTNSPFSLTNGQYGLNTSYFTPPATTGGGGTNPFAGLFGLLSGSGGGGNDGQPQQPYNPAPYPGPQYPPAGGGGTATPPQSWTSQYNPNRAGAKPTFGQIPYWGYQNTSTGTGTGNK